MLDRSDQVEHQRGRVLDVLVVCPTVAGAVGFGTRCHEGVLVIEEADAEYS